jgi:hypothetical protein
MKPRAPRVKTTEDLIVALIGLSYHVEVEPDCWLLCTHVTGFESRVSTTDPRPWTLPRIIEKARAGEAHGGTRGRARP